MKLELIGARNGMALTIWFLPNVSLTFRCYLQRRFWRTRGWDLYLPIFNKDIALVVNWT